MTDDETEEDHITSRSDDQVASTSAESGSQKEMKKIGHQCPMCDFVAKFPNKLRIHVSIKHPTQSRFPCTKCEKRFEEYIQLRKHCQEEHPKEHKCPDCEYKHRVKAYVNKHYKLNHVNGVICSLGCGRMVAMNMLKKHIEQCQKKNIVEEKIREPIEVWNNPRKVSELELKCEICGYVADKSSNDEKLIMEDLNMHISRIHGKGVKCPFECGKYLKVDEVYDHVRNEHAESAEMADELLRNEDTVSSVARVEEEDFVSSSDDEGIDSDGSENRYPKTGELLRNQCAKCLKTFNCSRDLTRHHNRVHKKKYDESKRKIAWKYCDFEKDGKKCDKKFKCQSLLDDHLNMHKNIYPYYCRNCDRKFTARARFAVHLSKYHQTSIKSYGLLKNNLFKK